MINIRDALSLIFTLGFFGIIVAHITDTVEIPELLLGAVIAQVTIVIQFYFRKDKP